MIDIKSNTGQRKLLNPSSIKTVEEISSTTTSLTLQGGEVFEVNLGIDEFFAKVREGSKMLIDLDQSDKVTIKRETMDELLEQKEAMKLIIANQNKFIKATEEATAHHIEHLGRQFTEAITLVSKELESRLNKVMVALDTKTDSQFEKTSKAIEDLRDESFRKITDQATEQKKMISNIGSALTKEIRNTVETAKKDILEVGDLGSDIRKLARDVKETTETLDQVAPKVISVNKAISNLVHLVED